MVWAMEKLPGVSVSLSPFSVTFGVGSSHRNVIDTLASNVNFFVWLKFAVLDGR